MQRRLSKATIRAAINAAWDRHNAGRTYNVQHFPAIKAAGETAAKIHRTVEAIDDAIRNACDTYAIREIIEKRSGVPSMNLIVVHIGDAQR
jgi:hypothetical protein